MSCQDKFLQKLALEKANFLVPKHYKLKKEDKKKLYKSNLLPLPFPLIVKPSHAESSKGFLKLLWSITIKIT